LRDRVLTAPPQELGFVADAEFPDVYGVPVDWPIGDVVASILALRDGSASLYNTSTFGIIGGGGHALVRAAARSCVRVAADFLAQRPAVTDFPGDQNLEMARNLSGPGAEAVLAILLMPIMYARGPGRLPS
jgi:hypothetical protein